VKAVARVLLLLACGSAAAKEDIEYVAEHLPEVAMDNRYATLPVWNPTRQTDGWSFAAQAGFGATSAGNLEIEGPMLALAASRALSQRWSVGVLAFADTLGLSGGEQRQLQTLFAPSTPILRPVDARFDGLDGRMRHYGAGLVAAMRSDRGWPGEHRWVGGVLFEQVELRDYRWNFQILAGDAAGTRGEIDFDNDYREITPFAGLQLIRERGDWTFSPHALFAMPLPRRGFVGHIQTAQFDIHGDQADAGSGKHFPDPSVTLGLDVTYRPSHLSFDIGTALTQELIEPVVHKGVNSDWVLSVRWQY
jgi:hypothetical protein